MKNETLETMSAVSAKATAAGAILTPMETGLLAEYLARIEAAKVAAEAAASAAAAAGGVTPNDLHTA